MPTYEMTIGMPGRSNALAIARRLGLEETVLDDAMQFIGAGSQRAESLLDTIYEMRERMTSQEAGTRLALRQAEEDRQQLRDRLGDIEAERQRLLDEARQEAQAELEAVREEIRQVRKTLRDTESLNQLKKLQKQTEQIEQEQVEGLGRDLEAELVQAVSRPAKRLKPGDLQVGDTVLVSSLGTRGQVVSLDQREAEVAIGRLRTRVDLDELEFKNRPEPEEQAPLPVGRPQTQSPGMELDLRGKRVDEGLGILEQYLDDAFLSNLPWVRIIHGKGTGRMREAVREALQSNSHVLSWEEGRDGEGGAGVTVAKLVEE
jgi:DNA mismatch repair protein MutS2